MYIECFDSFVTRGSVTCRRKLMNDKIIKRKFKRI